MSNVTVVVPAYNAEGTLKRAIESLLAQTIEVDIIVVNDGSTDRTGDVADALKGPHLKVVTQRNSGAYQARLRGWREVKTPFIGFMDADDIVETTMYGRLFEFARKYDLDVAQCDRVGGADVGKDIELFLTQNEVREHVVRPRLLKGADSVFVWDKIYKTDKFLFEPSNIMMFDDLAINCQVFKDVSRVGYLHEGLYRYEINSGSSVKNFRMKNIADLKEAIRFRNKYLPCMGFPLNDPSYSRWIVRNVRNMYIVAASAPIRDGVQRMDKIRALLGLPEVVEAFREQNRGWMLELMRSPLFAVAVGGLKRIKG